jgi:hypothetical protein
VCSFRCEDASPEIPDIFPEIPDFPETLEKSPEYPGFTDKFVLSGDFQDSPIHPALGDIKILSQILHLPLRLFCLPLPLCPLCCKLGLQYLILTLEYKETYVNVNEGRIEQK